MVDVQRRRWTIAAGVWFAAPVAAFGQPARRFRVGLLYGSSREGVRDTRLPAIYSQSRFADEGGLIAYFWQTLKAAVLAAEYADRILRGTRPGDLPVQEPTVIELVVNLATARAQGLKIPESVLLRADRIIE